jgi:hypothetical protein
MDEMETVLGMIGIDVFSFGSKEEEKCGTTSNQTQKD